MEDVNTGRPSFSFAERRNSLLEFNLRKNYPHSTNQKRGGISAIKFQALRLHFVSNVFETVVVDLPQVDCVSGPSPSERRNG